MRCGVTAEKKFSLGKDWHAMCLKCKKCNKLLTPGQHAEVAYTYIVQWQPCLLSSVHTSNNVEVTFDSVEATFDFVAKNGNNIERVYRKISSFRQSRNKLNTFRLFQLCRKNRSTCSIRQCCIDIVAGVDGALRCEQISSLCRPGQLSLN